MIHLAIETVGEGNLTFVQLKDVSITEEAKRTSLTEVVGENSAQVYEERSVRKLKENLKVPEEGSIPYVPIYIF